jgi:hypothetical protein
VAPKGDRGASLKPRPVAAEVVMDRRGKGERFVVINDDFHKEKGKHRDDDDDKQDKKKRRIKRTRTTRGRDTAKARAIN